MILNYILRSENIAMVTWHRAYYALPVGIIEKNRVKDLSIDDVFGDLINEHRACKK